MLFEFFIKLINKSFPVALVYQYVWYRFVDLHSDLVFWIFCFFSISSESSSNNSLITYLFSLLLFYSILFSSSSHISILVFCLFNTSTTHIQKRKMKKTQLKRFTFYVTKFALFFSLSANCCAFSHWFLKSVYDKKLASHFRSFNSHLIPSNLFVDSFVLFCFNIIEFYNFLKAFPELFILNRFQFAKYVCLPLCVYAASSSL